LNFLPSTKKKTELYLSIYKKLTSAKLNHFAKQAKLTKKTFSKATVVKQFPAKKNNGCAKELTDFPPRKDGILHPPLGYLGTPPTRVCTNGQSYADITTKISCIEMVLHGCAKSTTSLSKRHLSSLVVSH